MGWLKIIIKGIGNALVKIVTSFADVAGRSVPPIGSRNVLEVGEGIVTMPPLLMPPPLLMQLVLPRLGEGGVLNNPGELERLLTPLLPSVASGIASRAMFR